MKRTYGRKNSRRARPNSPDVEVVPSPPRKRPRIEVEIVQPPSNAHLSPPKVTSPIRRSTTVPDVSSISSTPSNIRTPTKPARDLSTLFSASPHRTPELTWKRMLSRSRTEPSVDHNASHSVCSLTPSSNTLPVHPSPPKMISSRSPSPTQSKPLPTKHTRTYAGASRSYRIALPAADLAEPDDTRESYADLRSRWGVDNSEDDPRPFDNDTRVLKRTSSVGSRVLANGMMNDLKSITELRSKGESRRFLDEVGYLFEGIESGCAIALRRARCVLAPSWKLLPKLCDPEFNRRAKISDFYARTWDVFVKAREEGPDKILDATLSFFAFLSTRDPQTLSELAHKLELGDGLNQGLKKDILALALSGVDASGLRASGTIRTDVAPLSTRTLVSTTLSSLPPSLLPPASQIIPLILNSLRAELLLVPPRVSAWERGLELFPGFTGTDIGLGENGKGKETRKHSDPPIDIATPSLAHIHACLCLVDVYLLEQWMGHVQSRSGVASDGSHETREELQIYRALADSALTDELVELCVAAEILVRDCVRDLDAMNKDETGAVEEDAKEGQGELARKTLFSTLRILTLLPSSTSSHSRPSSSYSRSSLTYSDALHTSWIPSDTALSLITRVVLHAQAGWFSLGGDGVKGERGDEATQGNAQHTAKPEDTDTTSSPLPGSRLESTRSPRKRAPFPVTSPSKLAHKPSSKTSASSKLGRQGHGSGTLIKGTSTSSQGNGMGKGKSKAISVPTYSLTRVESFDLLCLALGLLLNWASGGIEGEGVSEGMERILLNPACSATRNCAHICSCPPSSQLPLLSCLVSVYRAYSGSVFASTDSLSRKRNIVSGHEPGRKPLSACQKQNPPSASPSGPSTSPRHKTPSSQPTLNTSSMPRSPELTFLAGYTAVLLGLFCAPAAPREIRVLPTNRSLIFGDILIETLIRDVRDFLALYEDLEGELSSEGNMMDVDVDVGPDADGRRSGERGQGGGKGRSKALEKRSEDVARGVLRALEALQDDGP
ncbi:hypothetical protein EDB19DRAFT_1696430 [Suillus lakei]|nr:hypothetical protein EDB19DRAFT_1696430 [Suillus lakei]